MKMAIKYQLLVAVNNSRLENYVDFQIQNMLQNMLWLGNGQSRFITEDHIDILIKNITPILDLWWNQHYSRKFLTGWACFWLLQKHPDIAARGYAEMIVLNSFGMEYSDLLEFYNAHRHPVSFVACSE